MNDQKKLRKIAFWAVILLVTIVIRLLTVDSYTTPEIAFRRAERRNLIGPAQIMEQLDFKNSSYDHMFVAQSEYGYTLFEWKNANMRTGKISYQPKGDRATLFCSEFTYESAEREKAWRPIFAFCEDSTVVTAKLTFTIVQENETTTHTMETQRTDGGFFLFRQILSDLDYKKDRLIEILIMKPTIGTFPKGTATAELYLYDRDGNLIETITFT